MSSGILGTGQRVRLTSDGTSAGSQIEVRGEDGEWFALPGVTQARASFEINAGDEVVFVHLKIANVKIDVEGITKPEES